MMSRDQGVEAFARSAKGGIAAPGSFDLAEVFQPLGLGGIPRPGGPRGRPDGEVSLPADLTHKLATGRRLVDAGHLEAGGMLLDEVDRELARVQAARDETPARPDHVRDGLNAGLGLLVAGPADDDDEEEGEIDG